MVVDCNLEEKNRNLFFFFFGFLKGLLGKMDCELTDYSRGSLGSILCNLLPLINIISCLTIKFSIKC
jgi:hypothetical protein